MWNVSWFEAVDPSFSLTASKAILGFGVVSAACAFGNLIGSVFSFCTSFRFQWSVTLEHAVLSAVAVATQLVFALLLFSGVPLPLWVRLFLWLTSFIVIIRGLLMLYFLISLPVNLAGDKFSGAKVRLFSILLVLPPLACVIAMCIPWSDPALQRSAFDSVGTAILGFCALAVASMSAISRSVILKLDPKLSDTQSKLLPWINLSVALHTLWLASLAARAVTPATFSFQAAWTVVDLVWVLVSSVSIGSVIQNRKLNDFAAEWQSIVMVPAEGHRTTGVFVSEFTEEEVSLSLAEEMPIWRKWPASVSDLFRFPHPANEVQNRMHAGITTFVHLPVCLLLMYLLNSPWYILVPLLSTALRVTFGYRFDIQAWVVVLMSRLFDPLWVPGPPKRFAAFLSVGLLGISFGFAAASYNAVASWLLATHLVLSANQMLGLCLGCGIFFIATELGLVPEEECRRCMQRFVTAPPSSK